ncbi:MAG TPA: sulfatase-like hydrolase/transferase, partial [Bacteroidia bacterium]|nr:sulfatase-like hydrolase/transferase [Bacteroidia bacterium]
DKGWDWYRDEVLANQKKLGIVPQNVQIPEPTTGIKRWDALSADEKKVYARFEEAYAAFLEQTDYEIGRLISYLKSINQYDNTIFMVMVGDNGASKEGTPTGVHNGYINALKENERIPELLKAYNDIGTERGIGNYPLGWAQASNTPFRYLKQDANSEGGTHNPLIISWVKGIKDKGSLRNQYSHINSIYPTTIELTGAKIPTIINGYTQQPVEGISLGYTIDNAKAPTRHTQQYYEITGSRSIYKDGWKAAVYHKQGQPFESDVWELYNLNEDYNERNNVATQFPDKLKELQDAFDADARKYNIYPLKDWTSSAFGLDRVGAWAGQSQLVWYPELSHTFALSGPVLRNRSFNITADVEIKDVKNEGVLYAIGGHFGGFSLFIKENKIQAATNFGTKINHLVSTKLLTKGKHQIKFELNYTGSAANLFDNLGQFDNAGTITLYVDNEKVGERPILKGESSNIGGYDEGFDVGKDLITPVSDKYSSPFRFTGNLEKLVVDLK